MAEKEKILVLDDNPKWLKTVENILAPEYDLTLTQDNQEAINKVKSNNYVLVILDMKLTEGTTGIDVLIKMREKKPDLRAIILTGYNQSSLAVASMQAGALDYITKQPRLPDRLKESIAKHKKVQLIKVFLSYEHTDAKEVSSLHKKLTAQGFLSWIDRNDMGAGRWELQIKKAIRAADFFIPCLSKNSNRKEGFIRKEIKFALEKQDELNEDAGYIIPLRLDECEIPESLKDFHAVDLFKGGFSKLVELLLSKK